MLTTQRPRRTREYTGPTPHSVAIVSYSVSMNYFKIHVSYVVI